MWQVRMDGRGIKEKKKEKKEKQSFGVSRKRGWVLILLFCWVWELGGNEMLPKS